MDTNLVTQFESNVRKFYCMASETDKANGLAWYLEAHEFAKTLAGAFGLDLDTACRGIAVISPRLSWERNMSDAQTIASYWAMGVKDPTAIPTCALKANVAKAIRILDGDRDAISGPKVTAFADNILRPTESEVVTLDQHAYRGALGDVTFPYKATIPSKHKEPARQAYINVAREFGVSPLECQAVVWLAGKAEIERL